MTDMPLGTPDPRPQESLQEDTKDPVLHCPTCYSTKFQTSRVRTEDRFYLLVFKHPVRCRKCNARVYASRSYSKWLRKQEESGAVEKKLGATTRQAAR